MIYIFWAYNSGIMNKKLEMSFRKAILGPDLHTILGNKQENYSISMALKTYPDLLKKFLGI